jgi:hypothetical protein
MRCREASAESENPARLLARILQPLVWCDAQGSVAGIPCNDGFRNINSWLNLSVLHFVSSVMS